MIGVGYVLAESRLLPRIGESCGTAGVEQDCVATEQPCCQAVCWCKVKDRDGTFHSIQVVGKPSITGDLLLLLPPNPSRASVVDHQWSTFSSEPYQPFNNTLCSMAVTCFPSLFWISCKTNPTGLTNPTNPD